MRRLLFTAALLVALAVTAISFAAGRRLQVEPARTAQLPATPVTLVVPDVRRQAYVFAKGQLQDAGFAWKVTGGAPGYAANVVVSQSPAPGTRLVDTGSPLVTLRLERNKDYGSKGVPEDSSPYTATANRLAGTS